MNQDLKNLEAKLAALEPRKPSDRLKENLRAACEGKRQQKGRGVILWPLSIVAALAAILAFSFLIFNTPAAPPSAGQNLTEVPLPTEVAPSSESGAPETSPEDSFKPVVADNTLHNLVDEGIVFLRNGVPARRYRYQFIDRVVWENPENGARMEMEIPRDEVVLVPVQTF